MSTTQNVEALDIAEHVDPRFVARAAELPADALGFEREEDRAFAALARKLLARLIEQETPWSASSRRPRRFAALPYLLPRLDWYSTAFGRPLLPDRQAGRRANALRRLQCCIAIESPSSYWKDYILLIYALQHTSGEGAGQTPQYFLRTRIMPPLPRLDEVDRDPQPHDESHRQLLAGLTALQWEQRVRAERAAAIGAFLADLIVAVIRLPGRVVAATRRVVERAAPHRPAHE